MAPDDKEKLMLISNSFFLFFFFLNIIFHRMNVVASIARGNSVAMQQYVL